MNFTKTRYTGHEVTAPRVVGPSGRTSLTKREKNHHAPKAAPQF
jgi:hypothetical protein